MTFSERVKELKKEKHITNDALAHSCGIPLGTLGKLLSGFTGEPKLSTAVSIADALGCSVEYLATGREAPMELSAAETELISKYRALDAHGSRVCDYIINEEFMRVSDSARNVRVEISTDIFRSQVKAQKRETKHRIIPLFTDRVSAGTGVYLQSSETKDISIPDVAKTKDADFALRVSGNSMEPRFHDGDILLVRNTPAVEIGELGVFVCDGEGYFKKFGGDCLISLNPSYKPIMLDTFAEYGCRGAVVGVMHAKKQL